MKINKIAISLVLLATIFLSGCGMEMYYKDTLYNCVEGRYDTNDEAKQIIEDAYGTGIEAITVRKEKYDCVADIVFKDQIIQYGNSVKSIEMSRMNLQCAEFARSHNKSEEMCVR